MSGLRGRTLVPGEAQGDVLALTEPLSLWGGMDPGSGRVIDRHHPQVGASLAGRILLMPSGRGSSSASSVLAEAIRARTAPAGIVLREVDPIVALGALVAFELYGRACPVVVLRGPEFEAVPDGARVVVRAGEDEAIVEFLS